MAAALASAIITDMRYELKDTASDNYTDAELLVYIDEAQRMFVKTADKTDPATQSLWLTAAQTTYQNSSIVAGTAGYALPASFWMAIAVSMTDEMGETHPLPFLPTSTYYSQPQVGYTLIASHIVIHPIPSVSVASALTLYYCIEPTRVAAAATSVVWSDFFKREIQAWAVMLAKLRQEEDAMSYLTRAMMLRGLGPPRGQG